MQKFTDACKAGPDEPKAPPSSTVKGSIPSYHKIQVDGECIMQNKQLQSDWQQESASENLVGFVKYWPLGCQTGKWEIENNNNNKRKPNQPPPALQNQNHQKKVPWLYFILFKTKITTLHKKLESKFFFNGKDSFFF